MNRSYSLGLLGLWLSAVLVVGGQVSGIRFDNDTWLREDDPRRVQFDMFSQEFQGGEVLLVLLQLDGPLFEEERWQRLYRFETALKGIEGVSSIESPIYGTVIIDSGESLEIRSFQDAYQRGFIKDMADYRRVFGESPYAHKLLSADETMVALSLRLDSHRQGVLRERIAGKIDDLIAEHGLTDNAYYVGDAALKRALDQATARDLVMLLSFAALVLLVFLFWACGGSWRRTLLMAACTCAAVLSSLGWMVIFGHVMTAVSLMIPVLVAVIAIADGLHILSRWSGLAHLEPQERFRTMVQETWLPCLSASLTSAIGLGSFVLSAIVPLQTFGIDSFVSILWAYPTIVIVMWCGLWLIEGQVPHQQQQSRSHRWIDWLKEQTVGQKARRWVRAFAFVGVFMVSGLSMIYTETSFLSVFFEKESRLRQGFDLVDKNLGGSGRVDVVLARDEVEAYRTIKALQGIERLNETYRDLPLVHDVESYLIPVEMVHRAFSGKASLPSDDEQLGQELLFLEFSRSESTRDVLADYMDFDYRKARVSLQTPSLESNELATLISQVEEQTRRKTDDFIVTGFGVYIHTLNDYVLKTQVESLLLTLFLIAVLFSLQFGFRLGGAGFIANLLPLASTLGLVSWLGYPYDFATVLIAGITLGLSVDDTIHLLHHYRHKRKQGASVDEARQHALTVTAYPIAWTSGLFCCGLAVLSLSELVILQRFASFTIFGLVMAFFVSVLFLPALLGRLRDKKDKIT
ncbi:MAG: MMPL family transporter [Alphaproteobacteria bacterium GM202ARS2]|nr:MMPL family transporter [Alphaproteobacteria bacterium GM202ARS2]